MFGTNEAVPPKAFEHQPGGTLQVTSIFPTLQGEGPFAGRPAVFLRLTKCNLQCSFCDTYFDRGERMTFEDVAAAIAEAGNAFPLRRKYPPMLVVTGGEPLLQRNLADFLEWRRAEFDLFDEEVQIESNGNFYLELPYWVLVVVSPKVNEKTGQFIKVDRQLLYEGMVTALKFVISADMAGYQDVPQWALDWRMQGHGYREIYLSPMNCYNKKPAVPSDLADAQERASKERISFWTPGLLDHRANQRNHEHAARLTMKYSCILTLQQHLYAGLP
jgi:7-carboxy-7-deazaguanine synthase